MSALTGIEWTDRTWNPTTGCDKVSPGCAHCYAEGVANRFWASQYPKVRIVTGSHHEDERHRKFTDVLTHEDRLLEPLSWRKPSRVFVNSMSDLFHEDVPDYFIDHVFAVMALAPRHTFQVLTKRPERMRSYFAEPNRSAAVAVSAMSISKETRPFALPDERVFNARHVALGLLWIIDAWPLPNVWLGVSVENQHFADQRIPLLLQTPAAVRFISAEPLLGPVDISLALPCPTCRGRGFHPVKGANPFDRHPDFPASEACAECIRRSGKEPPPRGSYVRQSAALDWVIVGGESGPGARPFDLAWARAIVAQCKAAGVPVFVKQLGAKAEQGLENAPLRMMGLGLKDRKGGDMAEWPSDLQIREFPVVSR